MRQIHRFPLLDRQEEHDLAIAYAATGDRKAGHRLLTANLGLVVKLARGYARAHPQLLDLVQEGNLGLVMALDKYDPHRGIKLSTYAAWWIRAYILKFILDNSRVVRIGKTEAQRKLFFGLRREQKRLEARGITPSASLIARRLKVSELDVVDMERRLAGPDLSLDAPVGDAEDGRSQIDLLEASGIAPDEAVAKHELASRLHEGLERFGATLAGREIGIFRDRLLKEPPLTLREIGQRFGISRERARQIEAQLVERLRSYLKTELGSEVTTQALAA